MEERAPKSRREESWTTRQPCSLSLLETAAETGCSVSAAVSRRDNEHGCRVVQDSSRRDLGARSSIGAGGGTGSVFVRDRFGWPISGYRLGTGCPRRFHHSDLLSY